jgi:DNA-nicking Smr family endonuclease
VHGKGRHAGGHANGHAGGHAKGAKSGGVLKDIVYERLRRHRRAGETGIPDRSFGGSGAVWVALRSSRKFSARDR